MMKLIRDLWFKRRDIVSDGFDESLEYIAKIIPLKIHKFPSGTRCWTWEVPKKWAVEEAFIETLKGDRLLDLKNHPLHVISYSLPINKVVSHKELMEHLHTRRDRPKAIPFEFKYYEHDWGFCIEHNKLKKFSEKQYKVFINSSFTKGTLKVGDYTIPGKSKETIVIVTHLCHPAQVNDDLSGVAVAVELAKAIKKKKRYYTYKFLFLPETIGSIAYLSKNEKMIPQMKYGIFLEMLGHKDKFSLQYSNQGNTEIDQVAKYVMEKETSSFREGAFGEVVKNDESVFNGPGIDIPMISISRAKKGIPHYPQYHTSDDNLEIVSKKRLNESKDLVLNMINIIDENYIPKRKFKGPVFLSRYGLWVDWRIKPKLNKSINKIMSLLEGDKSVLDIAEELNMDFEEIYDYLEKFYKNKLITKNY